MGVYETTQQGNDRCSEKSTHLITGARLSAALGYGTGLRTPVTTLHPYIRTRAQIRPKSNMQGATCTKQDSICQLLPISPGFFTCLRLACTAFEPSKRIGLCSTSSFHTPYYLPPTISAYVGPPFTDTSRCHCYAQCILPSFLNRLTSILLFLFLCFPSPHPALIPHPRSVPELISQSRQAWFRSRGGGQ
jgi:hypothetical protein